MPNAIAADKRSVTYLENREVLEWMEREAAARGSNVTALLREATSAYYVAHKEPGDEPGLFVRRSAAKAAQRALTERQIASGQISPEEAQRRNAPVREPVAIVNLWPAIRRYARARA